MRPRHTATTCRTALPSVSTGAVRRSGRPAGAGGGGAERWLAGRLIRSQALVVGALGELLHERTLVGGGHVELELDAVEEVQKLRRLELALDVHGAEGVGLGLDGLAVGRLGRRRGARAV